MSLNELEIKQHVEKFTTLNELEIKKFIAKDKARSKLFILISALVSGEGINQAKEEVRADSILKNDFDFLREINYLKGDTQDIIFILDYAKKI